LLAVLLAGAAMYALGRELFGRAAGIVAGALYVTLPYVLVDLYVRGAVAETLALALLPVTALALRRVVQVASPGRVALAGVTVGALILAHNITALLALPVLAVLAWLARPGARSVPA